MEPVPLVFWRSPCTEPVRDWLYELPREDQRAVGRDLFRMQFAWVMDVNAFPRVAERIWEVRSPLSNKRVARFLVGYHKGKLIALSLFFAKAQKPPEADLEFARRRLEMVTERGKKRNPRIGSTFESWLVEQGIREEASAAAVKYVIGEQIARMMKRHVVTKSRMAEVMQTSRVQLGHLLNPDSSNATLETLMRAAKLLGGELRLELP
ncbi:MAG: type II toxin-antitoxin system RelE/ParE family toxin [Steroidobacteraceae bacterium]